MRYYEDYHIKETVADWLYASADVPESICKIATDLAMVIFSEIRDYRAEIDFDWSRDLPDCTADNITFDLMTIICFEGESTDTVRLLPRQVKLEERGSVCREYGIPDAVLECIMEWNRRRTSQNPGCIGIEACLPDAWGVPSAELSNWKRQYNC